MSTHGKAIQSKPQFSTLDVVLLAPLAAPLVVLPLGMLAWGVYRFGAGYAAAVHATAAPAARWDWPWCWPGARAVEAFYAALGLPPASNFSFMNPLRPFSDLEVIDRALMALFVNGIIAALPLWLAVLLIGALVRARRCASARRSA